MLFFYTVWKEVCMLSVHPQWSVLTIKTAVLLCCNWLSCLVSIASGEAHSKGTDTGYSLKRKHLNEEFYKASFGPTFWLVGPISSTSWQRGRVRNRLLVLVWTMINDMLNPLHERMWPLAGSKIRKAPYTNTKCITHILRSSRTTSASSETSSGGFYFHPMPVNITETTPPFCLICWLNLRQLVPQVSHSPAW